MRVLAFLSVCGLIVLSVFLFLVEGWLFPTAIAGASLLLLLILRADILRLLRMFAFSVFFLVTVFLFNFWWGGAVHAGLVVLRLTALLLASFLLNQAFTQKQLSGGIAFLFLPFCLFGVAYRKIWLIIHLALNFIGLQRKEYADIKTTLKARGASFAFWNGDIFRTQLLLLKLYFLNMFRRVDEMEQSMKARGMAD